MNERVHIYTGSLFEPHIVLADYTGESENELSVKAGDIVQVVQKLDSGKCIRGAEEGGGGGGGGEGDVKVIEVSHIRGVGRGGSRGSVAGMINRDREVVNMGGVYVNVLTTFTYLALAASSCISYAQKSKLFL